MKKVLITGGAGFIGSNLADRLISQGYTVRILRRDNSDLRTIRGIEVEHCIGDVRDPISLLAAVKGCDTVFHTAAIVSFVKKKYAEQVEVNVTGTRNVVDACLGAGIEKLVHTSSVAAIGYPPDGQLVTEETEFNWGGSSGYKWTKHLAEQEVRAATTRGLNAVIVNPSVVVGERDIHFHGGELLRAIKRGKVPLYIDGGMNIVYVGDVVDGHIQAALKGRKGERYILSGENLSHKEIFRRTAELIDGRAPFGRLPIPALRGAATLLEFVASLIGADPIISRDLVTGAGRLNWFACDKAMRELDYRITPFDTTILRAYRWYRENGLL